ncbi:MAG TPA: hypothetical protein VF472_03155 [Burkholderiaceae bacterium]
MSVSSVPSSTGTVSQAPQAPKATHKQNAGPAQSLTQNGGTQQTQQATQTQTVQAPKPVVNGQGQKTGQILNTTA